MAPEGDNKRGCLKFVTVCPISSDFDNGISIPKTEQTNVPSAYRKIHGENNSVESARYTVDSCRIIVHLN